MPELPEVHTTATILNKLVTGKSIRDVWTNYGSPYHQGKSNIKDKKYFSYFRDNVIGNKILGVSRVGKNILIKLSKRMTILVHMKMTGHLLYGKYQFLNNSWMASKEGPLQDPYNGFIRLVFTLSDKKHLALSDMRRFAKVFLHQSDDFLSIDDLKNIGPDPLSKKFDLKKFSEVLKTKKHGKVKQVLMDQSVLSGIGNIYSDEMLWLSGIQPERKIKDIGNIKLRKLFHSMKKILKMGIDFGGDSMSDYRNPHGKRGAFQHKHRAYRKTGEKCSKSNCFGIIKRIKVAGRSAHFCSKHQK